MFPIEGRKQQIGKNISTIIFPTEVRLRLRSTQQGCSKAVKTKDMGVFLTTYLFVKSSVRK
jgi:hypothetical protein